MNNSSAANFPSQGAPVQRHEGQEPATFKEVAHKAAEEVKDALDSLANKAIKLGQAAVNLPAARKVRALASAVKETWEITSSPSPDKLKGMGKSAVAVKTGRKMNGFQTKMAGSSPKPQQPGSPSQMAGKMRPDRPPPPIPQRAGQPGKAATATGTQPEKSLVSPQAGQQGAVVHPPPKKPLPAPPQPGKVATGPQPEKPVGPPQAGQQGAVPQASPRKPLPALPQQAGQPSKVAISPQPDKPAGLPQGGEPAASKAQKTPDKQRLHSTPVSQGERRAAMKRMQEQLAPDLKQIADDLEKKTEQALEKKMKQALHASKVVKELVDTEKTFVKCVEAQRVLFSHLALDPKLTAKEKMFVQDFKDFYTRMDKEMKSFSKGLDAASLASPGKEEEAKIKYYAENLDNFLKLIQEGIQLQSQYVQMPDLKSKVASLAAAVADMQAVLDPIVLVQRGPRLRMLMQEIQKYAEKDSPLFQKASIAESKVYEAVHQANKEKAKIENTILHKTARDIQQDFAALRVLAQQPQPDLQTLRKAAQDFLVTQYKFPEKTNREQKRIILLKAAQKGKIDEQTNVKLQLSGIEGKLKEAHSEQERQDLLFEKRLLESLHPDTPEPLSAEDLKKVKEDREKLEKEPKQFPISEPEMQEVFTQIIAHMEKQAKT